METGSGARFRKHAATSPQDAVREELNQTRVSRTATIQARVTELTEENNSLRCKLQRSEREYKELGQLRKEENLLHQSALEENRRLQRVLERKCERPECVGVKAELEDVKKRIMQMEKKQCNSENCKNQELKDMNDTIGFKIRIGDREYSHSEALQFLVQRAKTQHPSQSEEVKTLQSHLQRMQQEKQHLEEKLESALGSNAPGRCTKSDCRRIQEQLQRMQSEHRQGRSAAKDMTLMCGGEYDQPLEEFNEVFTNPDELLGVLESGLESFEAKKVLCKIFQCAYELCKVAALKRMQQTLEDLFTVSEDKSRKEDISRAYGLLLHVSGLKNDEATCRDICRKIVTDKAAEAYGRVGSALQAEEEYLLKCVKVAWKFVTLPSPIIVCRPEKYNPQIVEREFGYWNKSTPDAKLIYTRPVVYRCYDGNRAEKGMVANTETCSMPE